MTNTNKKTECKGCGGELHNEEVMNSLSRYEHGYICNDCGTREAFKGDFIRAKYTELNT